MTRRRRGKRDRTSPNPPSKRQRGGSAAPEFETDELEAPPAPVLAPPSALQPSLVMVAGLPPGCGVLELKSRLEAYGAISRTRIDDAADVGYVSFRSGAAAEAAIAASLDPDGGITIGSNKVLVVRASEAPNNWRTGVQADPAEGSLHAGTNKKTSDASAIQSSKSASQETYKGREIVGYDDLF